ncbi:ABC transporter permease [Curtobacterium sp. S6]|uniref:ABC transporter permease n=1 Tax=Curtobacterium sp. S6 TaxID=1479623 RepID=UPI00069132C1|nr:iron ABC transporter permease [Curtobacterium sp. S6]
MTALKKRGIHIWILTAIVLIALYFVVLLPSIRLLGQGLSSQGITAFTKSIVGTGGKNVLVNTVILGCLVGLVGMIAGFVLAMAQTRLRFRGKRIFHWIAMLPLISPPFAIATATVTLFGRRGLITDKLLGLDVDVYGLPGLVIVLALSFTPVSYMNFSGMIRNLDPTLEEAAQSLGASHLTTLRKVILPMLLPGFATAFLLLFVEAAADLANPLALGGDFRVLASEIYFAVAGNGDISYAAGVAVALLIPSLSVFLIQRYWVSKKSVVSVTGKPSGQPKPLESWWIKAPIGILAGAWILLILLMYLTIVAGGFVTILGVKNDFSWEHYEFIFRLGKEAIVTTTVMTLIAAPFAVLIGTLTAWLVVRQFKRFGAVLDLVGMLGLAVPGTILGLGFAIAYSQPTWLFGVRILPALAAGGAVLGGAVAIVMVYIARGLPASQQSSIAALRQVSTSLEEAAASLGAGPLTVLRKVTAPLIYQSMLTGFTYTVTRSMTVITAVIFIITPQTKVMAGQILDEVDAGRFGNAFAYCTLLIAIVLAILVVTELLHRLLGRRGIENLKGKNKS